MIDDGEERIRESEALIPGIVEVSAKAFLTFSEAIEELDRSELKGHQSNLLDMVLHAENTSKSVELLRAHGLVLQSLALLRVRLEETIVCSYIIHERSDDVRRRYFSFGPIAEYLTARKLKTDPYLGPRFGDLLDTARLHEQAAAVERMFNPGFDLEADRFTPKWTALDPYSMALRRDVLAKGRFPAIPIKAQLAPLYNSFYKTASAVVHADASVLSSPFVGKMKGLDGIHRDSDRFWRMLIPPVLVMLDQLQCLEVLATILEGAEG